MWQESGLSVSSLGRGIGDVPTRAEHGRGIGLERKMNSYIIDMLSLSCLWDLKGKRWASYSISPGLGFLLCKTAVIILPTIGVAVLLKEIKHIQCCE